MNHSSPPHPRPAPALLDGLRSEGYVVTDLFEQSELRRLRSVVDEAAPSAVEGVWSSCYDGAGTVAEMVDAAVRPIVEGPVERAMPNHRIVVCGVTSKGPCAGPVPFHQDWTHTDERRGRSIFVWCPLIDVDRETGCLRFIPASHRWSDGLRPSRQAAGEQRDREPIDPIQGHLEPLAVDVPLRAGQAVVFDTAAIHASWPNRSVHVRHSLTIALIPSHLPLLHFHQRPDGSVHGYAVDDSHFTSAPYGGEPRGGVPYAAWTEAVTTEAILLAAASHERAPAARPPS